MVLHSTIGDEVRGVCALQSRSRLRTRAHASVRKSTAECNPAPTTPEDTSLPTPRNTKTAEVIQNLEAHAQIAPFTNALYLAQKLRDCRCWMRSNRFCEVTRVCQTCNSRMRARRLRNHYLELITALIEAAAAPVTVRIRLDAHQGFIASKLEMRFKVDAFLAPMMSGQRDLQTNPLRDVVAAGCYGIQVQVDPTTKSWLLLALLWIRPGTEAQTQKAIGLLKAHVRDLGHADDGLQVRRLGGQTTQAVVDVAKKWLNVMNAVWDVTQAESVLELQTVFSGRRRRGGWFGTSLKQLQEYGLEPLSLDPAPAPAVYIPRAPRPTAAAVPALAHAQARPAQIASKTPVAPSFAVPPGLDTKFVSPKTPPVAPKPLQKVTENPQHAHHPVAGSTVSYSVSTPTQSARPSSSAPRAFQALTRITTPAPDTVTRPQPPPAPKPAAQPLRSEAPAPRAPQAPAAPKPACAPAATAEPAPTLPINRAYSRECTHTPAPAPVSHPMSAPTPPIRPSPSAPKSPPAPTTTSTGVPYIVGSSTQAPRAPRPSTTSKPWPPKAPDFDTDIVLDDY